MTPVVIRPEFLAWRRAARDLLARRVPPETVVWQEERQAQPLLGLELTEASVPPPPVPAPAAANRVPRRFLSLARRVACHRDPSRWELLYRVLWRLQHEGAPLLQLEIDPDIRALALMNKAIARDIHKMHAFVRFRPRPAMAGEGEPWSIAWYEPDHRIVGLAAPFFVRRFRAMPWSILTPDCSAHWNGRRLRFGPGAHKSDAPDEDALDDLWRTYYLSIFNPARVNVRALRAELPVRRWKNLPEGPVIVRAIADAPARVSQLRESATRLETAAPFVPPVRDLAALARAAAGCQGCSLHRAATQTVFGEGPADARLVLIGEQAGDAEDRAGRPFVGPAGQLLDRALAEAAIPRSGLYVTNAVKHFKFEPRGKWRIHKRPSTGEMLACQPWLDAELATLQPRLLVCLGAVASQTVFGPQFRLLKERGRVIDTRYGVPALATRHPSSVLRMSDEVQQAAAFNELVNDLRTAASTLAAIG